MKILFLTVGNELVASSRTRVYQYLPYFKKANISYRIIKYESGLNYWFVSRFNSQNIFSKITGWFGLKFTKQFHRIYSTIQVIRLVFYSNFVDVLFIQKALLPIWVQNFLKSVQPNIVFDFDDAIYADTLNFDRNRIDHQLSFAKLAILENEETEKYAQKHNIRSVRITGPIDCQRYLPRRHLNSYDRAIIGWIGSSSTTQYLRLIEEPLQIISKKKQNVTLELIGAGHFVIDGVNVIEQKWSLNTEVELLHHFDIGIMPLFDNEYSRGKGGYKILQYMAMGIPSIASPVGINKELIIDGENGFLASDSNEWVEKLIYLLDNPEIRSNMGQAARKIALTKYSFDVNFPILEKLLKEISGDK